MVSNLRKTIKVNLRYQLSTEYSFSFFCFAHVDGSGDVIHLTEQFQQAS